MATVGCEPSNHPTSLACAAGDLLTVSIDLKGWKPHDLRGGSFGTGIFGIGFLADFNPKGISLPSRDRTFWKR